jgi:hypothetical protein
MWLKSSELAYPVIASICCILVLYTFAFCGLLIQSRRKVYYTKPVLDCQGDLALYLRAISLLFSRPVSAHLQVRFSRALCNYTELVLDCQTIWP